MDSLRKRFPEIEKDTWAVLAEWAVLLRSGTIKSIWSRVRTSSIWRNDIWHCLAITPHLKLMHGARLMDVGTGGGFPGLIMAICYPQARFTLVDSVGKKIAVVADIAERLGLPNVEVRHGRAELVKKEYDFITGRAVKNLPEFLVGSGETCVADRAIRFPTVCFIGRGDLVDEFNSLGIQPRRQVDLGTGVVRCVLRK